MKRIGIAGLLIGVVLALNAISASSASAAEWVCERVSRALWITGAPPAGGQCRDMSSSPRRRGWGLVEHASAKKIAPGVLCALVEAGEPSLFNGSSCGASEEHEGTGGYEEAFEPPYLLNSSGEGAENATFTGKSPTGKLQAEGTNITCSSSTSTGTITGASNVGKVLVTYSGCEKGTTQCRTPGQATGKIVTELLAGKLGETTQASSGVGLLLAPETGTKFTELESTGRSPCVSAGDVLITGSVIGEVLPVNGAAQTTGKLIFEKAGEVTQKITAFTGGGEDTLLAFGGLRSSIEQSNELTFSEAVQVAT